MRLFYRKFVAGFVNWRHYSTVTDLARFLG